MRSISPRGFPVPGLSERHPQGVFVALLVPGDVRPPLKEEKGGLDLRRRLEIARRDDRDDLRLRPKLDGGGKEVEFRRPGDDALRNLFLNHKHGPLRGPRRLAQDAQEFSGDVERYVPYDLDAVPLVREELGQFEDSITFDDLHLRVAETRPELRGKVVVALDEREIRSRAPRGFAERERERAVPRTDLDHGVAPFYGKRLERDPDRRGVRKKMLAEPRRHTVSVY